MANIVQCFKEMFTDISRRHQYMIISLKIWRMSVDGVAAIFSTKYISYTKSNALVFRFYKTHLHL